MKSKEKENKLSSAMYCLQSFLSTYDHFSTIVTELDNYPRTDWERVEKALLWALNGLDGMEVGCGDLDKELKDMIADIRKRAYELYDYVREKSPRAWHLARRILYVDLERKVVEKLAEKLASQIKKEKLL